MRKIAHLISAAIPAAFALLERYESDKSVALTVYIHCVTARRRPVGVGSQPTREKEFFNLIFIKLIIFLWDVQSLAYSKNTYPRYDFH